jgi:hypothetical protein
MAEDASDWGQRIEDIALGLLTLEINTISKSGMSAQKMPAAPMALHVIVEDYAEFMHDKGYPITNQLMKLAQQRVTSAQDDATAERQALAAWAPADADAAPAELTNGAVTFEALKWAAQAALRDDDRARGTPGATPLCSTEERAVLNRIMANGRQLRQVALALASSATAADKELYDATLERTSSLLIKSPRVITVPTNTAILMRKAWEIGTETVLFQSVIQIDGDVVTRLSPVIGNAERGFLAELHKTSVQTSIAQWQAMFNLVCSLISEAAAMVLGGRRPTT